MERLCTLEILAKTSIESRWRGGGLAGVSICPQGDSARICDDPFGE